MYMQRNKKHRRLALLNSSHLTGHPLGFHLQSAMLEQHSKKHKKKGLRNKFHLNVDSLRFHPQIQRIGPHCIERHYRSKLPTFTQYI